MHAAAPHCVTARWRSTWGRRTCCWSSTAATQPRRPLSRCTAPLPIFSTMRLRSSRMSSAPPRSTSARASVATSSRSCPPPAAATPPSIFCAAPSRQWRRLTSPRAPTSRAVPNDPPSCATTRATGMAFNTYPHTLRTAHTCRRPARPQGSCSRAPAARYSRSRQCRPPKACSVLGGASASTTFLGAECNFKHAVTKWNFSK